MPSWKKVITSGSHAELASLYAPSITGSLHGTASWAENSISASYVTGSGVYGPYGSNSVISSSYASSSALSNATLQTDILVLNQTGFNIPKGTVVRITGSNTSSDIPRVTTASYEDDTDSANTLGITTQTINNGAQGLVITEGVQLGIDTSNFISGQLIYLGPTGSIIGSPPVAPLHTVRLGQVVRHQSNNGSIHVRIDNGYELNELHDVLITSASTGDIITWDSASRVWKNSKQLTGSYTITGSLIISSSGATNDFQIGDNKLFVSASGNIGIGTTSPTTKLNIIGDTGLRVGRSAGGDTQYIDINQNIVGVGQPAITSYSPISNAKFLRIDSTTNNLNTPSTTGSIGIVLATYGAGALWVDSKQFVGVGIAAPTAKLHVNNTTTSASFLVEDSTNPDTTPFIIDNAGLVGIGTTSPTTSLHIVAPAIAGAETIQRWQISDSDAYIQVQNGTAVSASTFIPLLSSGQVTSSNAIAMGFSAGIGTDTGNNPAMLFQARSGSGATILNRPLFRWSNWVSDLMWLDATGSLSIGVSTAAAKLHINNTSAGNSFLVEDATNPDTTPFIIDNAGLVGIGTTTPNALLTVSASNVNGILLGTNTGTGLQEQSGRLMFGSITSSNTVTLYASSGSLNIATEGTPNISSGTTKMFISSSGNVGIGTTIPTLATLQVNGNVYATSFTGSLQGTSSWANNASTASYLNPLTQSVNITGSLIVTGSFDASSYSNKIISITELTSSALVTHSIGTSTFTAINLNSDGTNRFAKASFVAPQSGRVQIRMEFDMTIVNSAAVQMIGLHNTSSATSTPSEGWYRVNADNDSTSGQFYASFIETGLTPGTTYNYYFMGVCDFTGNLVRISSVQTGSYSAGLDRPSPLRIYVYDLGGVSITSNPSS